jgi:hypothetical protein
VRFSLSLHGAEYTGRLWDEDIGVADFDPNRCVSWLKSEWHHAAAVTGRRTSCAHRYMQIVQLHGLDISQPAISSGPVSWPITRRMPGSVLHRWASWSAVLPRKALTTFAGRVRQRSRGGRNVAVCGGDGAGVLNAGVCFSPPAALHLLACV